MESRSDSSENLTAKLKTNKLEREKTTDTKNSQKSEIFQDIAVFLPVTLSCMFLYYGLTANTNLPNSSFSPITIARVSTKLANTLSKNTDSRKLRSIENPDNCRRMLNDGHWKFNGETDQHLQCMMNETCKMNAWEPEGCEWHRYTPEDSQLCLKEKKVLVLGDSRGRQTYIALKNRLTGEADLMDEVEHHNLKYEKHGGQVRWAWKTNIHDGGVEKMLARMVSENSTMERPDLFIINSLLLHPTSHLNRTLCFEQLSTFKAVALNSIFPLLREVAKLGTKILWLASEDMFPKHVFTADQVDALRAHNEFLQENLNQFSPDLKFMSFLGVNRKTVYTPNGNLLLGDGTHKLQRRVTTQVPASLWSDINVILNYFCNDFMLWDDATCCVSKK